MRADDASINGGRLFVAACGHGGGHASIWLREPPQWRLSSLDQHFAMASRATMLNWDDLRVVLAVAENGTISGAAAVLRISHPTLSRRLRQIEERLGVRLFERTPSACLPTEVGEEMRV